MNITKKIISAKIANETGLKTDNASSFVDLFFKIIKTQSRNKSVKISNFGTFKYKKTKKRIGRNPKTLEEYSIDSIKKFYFRSSSKVKKIIN